MKIEKIYSIGEDKWEEWGKTIADAINDFYRNYAFQPNILEANKHTFSQFDFLSNVNPKDRERVANVDDVTGKTKLPDKEENILLNGYNYCDTEIEFAVDNLLSDKEFRLIYDDEPEWDEPELPVGCPENEFEPSGVLV